MIDIAIKQLLVERSGLADSAKITPGSERVPTDKGLPRLVYTLIDDPRAYNNDGVNGLRKATYQLDAFGKNHGEARGVLLQVTRPATIDNQPGLDGYRGTKAKTAIKRIYFGSDRVGTADAAPGQNQTAARATVDLMVDYRELLQQPNFQTT